MDYAVWVPTVVNMNRGRLLDGEIADVFFRVFFVSASEVAVER